MKRSLLIKLHLYVAAFVGPVVLLVGASGGLYLMGFKGHMEKVPITVPTEAELDLSASDPSTEVARILEVLNIDHTFEYVQWRGQSAVVTRPTSRTHFEFRVSGRGVAVRKLEPSLLASLIELHKGHGPVAFRSFQMVVAGGLIFVVLSGLWLGLTSTALRPLTLFISSTGVVTCAWLALA